MAKPDKKSKNNNEAINEVIEAENQEIVAETSEEAKSNEKVKASKNAKKDDVVKKDNKKNKKQKKQDGPKRNIVKESFSELKKVTWPSFGQVVKNTLIVLGIVIALTAALFVIDLVLSWLYQLMVDGSITKWI